MFGWTLSSYWMMMMYHVAHRIWCADTSSTWFMSQSDISSALMKVIDNVSTAHNMIAIWSKLESWDMAIWMITTNIYIHRYRDTHGPFSKSFRCMCYLLRDSFVCKCLCFSLWGTIHWMIRLVTSLFISIEVWKCEIAHSSPYFIR